MLVIIRNFIFNIKIVSSINKKRKANSLKRKKETDKSRIDISRR